MNRSMLLGCTVLVMTVAGVTTATASPGTGVIRDVAAEGRLQPGEVTRFISPLFEEYPRPEIQNPVDVYELRIVSAYPDGSPTEVRVQVFLPVSDQPLRGAYLFAPGTTGLIGPCRPSREHVAGIRWGLYRAHVLAFAGQGFVGILPDYIGFEDSRQVQPYFHAESEARIIFDAYQAVDQWITAYHPQGLAPLRRVAGGFSQGGHAVFAAADRNHNLGRELPLHGVIGYGATTAIEPLFLKYPSLAPMMIEALSAIYGRSRIDPAEIFQAPWAETLTYDTTRQCVGGMQGYYPGSPEKLFTSGFLQSLRAGTLAQTFPSIAEILRENRTGLTRHGVPALILQGTDDIVIQPERQEEFVDALRELGNPVDYRLYHGARHDTRQVSFADVLLWIDQLPRLFQP